MFAEEIKSGEGEIKMKEEYSFNLAVPLEDVEKVEALLAEAKAKAPVMRISRKPDRGGSARFYLSFPLSGARPDLTFEKWFVPHKEKDWDLLGPTYGRWGFC
jgi:hypothetical protein